MCADRIRWGARGKIRRGLCLWQKRCVAQPQPQPLHTMNLACACNTCVCVEVVKRGF